MSRFQTHPEMNALRCPGGLFDVEPGPLDLEVGKRCRFVRPTCPAEKETFRIVAVQKNWRGEFCFRVQSRADSFGRVARPSDVIIF